MSIELENKAPLLVLVTVGSEHHPFDRMVGWVDEWLRQSPELDVRCVVQYGTSTPPTVAEGYDFVDHHKLQALMSEAAVIVTQGGPMSILEARGAGKVPIVIPRNPQLREHVDGHQQLFAGRMADEGLARVPADEAEFDAMLDEAIAHPTSFVAARDESATDRVDATVERFGKLVAQLMPAPENRRTRLVLVMGQHGSESVARSIARASGVAAVGDTFHRLGGDANCTCGRPIASCEFWHDVGHDAFGGWHTPDGVDFVGLRAEVLRTPLLPAILGPTARVSWRLHRDRLARLVRAFFETANKVTNSPVLVASTAVPAYAALLTRCGLQLHCVQVLPGHSPGTGTQNPAATLPSTAVAQRLLWSALTRGLRMFGRGDLTVTSIHYEDFSADPEGSTEQILQDGLTRRSSGGRAPSGRTR